MVNLNETVFVRWLKLIHVSPYQSIYIYIYELYSTLMNAKKQIRRCVFKIRQKRNNDKVGSSVVRYIYRQDFLLRAVLVLGGYGVLWCVYQRNFTCADTCNHNTIITSWFLVRSCQIYKWIFMEHRRFSSMITLWVMVIWMYITTVQFANHLPQNKRCPVSNPKVGLHLTSSTAHKPNHCRLMESMWGVGEPLQYHHMTRHCNSYPKS